MKRKEKRREEYEADTSNTYWASDRSKLYRYDTSSKPERRWPSVHFSYERMYTLTSLSCHYVWQVISLNSSIHCEEPSTYCWFALFGAGAFLVVSKMCTCRHQHQHTHNGTLALASNTHTHADTFKNVGHRIFLPKHIQTHAYAFPGYGKLSSKLVVDQNCIIWFSRAGLVTYK